MHVEDVQLRVSLTGRYATALFKECSTQSSVEDISRDIHAFLKLLDQHPKLQQILKSKLLKCKDLNNLIDDISAGMNFSKLFINFLKTLALQHRFPVMLQIFRDFFALVDAENNTVAVRVEVVSIERKFNSAIEKIIKKSYPKQNLRFEYHESPSLLGGFRAFIKGYCLDYSLKSRLNRLTYQLKEA